MPKTYRLTPAPGDPTRKVPFEKELNAEQFRVVTSGAGPKLVLAGPGSGKTRTLTYRVAFLIHQGIPARNILLMTFTVKAAREMLGRVEQILGSRPEGLWGGTFHHIANRLLRQHAQRIGLTPHFSILDEEDVRDLLSSCVKDLKLDAAPKRFPKAAVIESWLSLAINTRRNLSDVVAEQGPQFLDQITDIEQVAARYAKRKLQGNAVDYDDMLTLWLKLLTEHPAVREQVARNFQVILVDEYQDTNRLQFEIIRALSHPHRNLLAVGDDAQSIYAFRGADIRNLLDFPKVFPGTEIHRLETNYRSTPEILALANASIQFNREQFPKTLHAVRESGEKPAVVPLTDGKQQAAFIAQRVLELREEGIPLAEIGVLLRARYQAAELEMELARRNLPYVVRGGVRFFEQAHIKDVMAHLRILANPRDAMAWERILRLQEGIGPAGARKIWERLLEAPEPLQAALKPPAFPGLSEKATRSFRRLQKTLQQLAQGRDRKLSELIGLILSGGYEEQLKERFENARDRREDLEQLMNLAVNYGEVDRFLEDFTLREPFRGETIKGWEPEDESLTVSTIHQAKGLEWRAVFVLGLAEGQFPHAKSVEEERELEEERRLFYVAVTRTQSELYLTYPLTRTTYQRGEVLQRPSTFLQELPEDVFELWRVGEESAPLRQLNQLSEEDSQEPEPDWPI
ncbi:MAG: hypothetical protein COV76_05680 [Candidatus Omnitrophica bacterium CG11_big_fil_rev_8_21_14_0_20_64_10]|nr:MAG: hypothetical protein COV76_05680 [Candidatus Omnitrophica bacterium CG11_big_fil_rev_8_21_14_0_20_64_10]